MANDIAVGFGFLAIVVMWASVIGSVERQERFAFALGIALVLLGLTFLSGSAGAVVVLVGFVVVAASTVPLLRGSTARG